MEKEKMLQDILETVVFIKDNAVTKEEFLELKDEMNKRFTKVEALMVTKDYLDDKLADLKGDIIVKQRKIEERINTLVTMLSNRKVLEQADVKLLSELRVFPYITD